MKRALYIVVVLLLWASGPVAGQSVGRFSRPQPPAMLSGEQSEAEWLALHYWDHYDFSRAAEGYDKESNQVAFFDFLSILYATSPEHSRRAIEEMMNRASKSEDGYWYFLEMAELVLYDPSSPMRNDLLWEVFLRHAVGPRSPLDGESRVRYISLLKIVGRNQQGTASTDFVYTLPDGRQGRLYDIDSPLTLIYFYNPGCSECARTRSYIESSGYLDKLHKAGSVEVLAIYPDSDEKEWRKSLNENPKWWITAYDKGEKIRGGELYDLKAIPTIYLLDGQKRVMMKDPTVEDLVRVLGQLCGSIR